MSPVMETYCWWSLARAWVQPPLSAHLLLLHLWSDLEALPRLRVTAATFSQPSPCWSLSSKDLVTQPNSELLDGRALYLPFLSPSRPRKQGKDSTLCSKSMGARAQVQLHYGLPVWAGVNYHPLWAWFPLAPYKVLEILSPSKATSR